MRLSKNNDGDEATKISMSLKKGSLEVQGERYEKKIVPPTPAQILQYPYEEVNRICEIELKSSEQYNSQGSSFFGYAVPTNNHKIIQDAYMKLRLLFPQAKHIVLGYVLPGMPRCYNEGYCDDGETGAGRILLQLLKKHKLRCLSIFVIRLQDGPKIGALRYTLLEKTAINAVNINSYNKFLNATQQIIEEAPVELPSNRDLVRIRGAPGPRRQRGRGLNNRGGRAGF